MAIDQEDGEEAAKRVRQVALDSLFDTADPFVIGLGETTGDARVTESGVEDTVDGLEVVEAGRAGDIEQETTEVEAFPGSRHHRVHTPDGFRIVFACGPEVFLPSVRLRDVGVLDRPQVGVVGHECEEGGEGSLIGPLDDRRFLSTFDESHMLLVREVDCEAGDGGIHAVHVELEAAVCGLRSRDEASVQEVLYVVSRGRGRTGQSGAFDPESGMSAVVALVNVLVHVLDGLDGAANLDVDVAVVL